MNWTALLKNKNCYNNIKMGNFPIPCGSRVKKKSSKLYPKNENLEINNEILHEINLVWTIFTTSGANGKLRTVFFPQRVWIFIAKVHRPRYPDQGNLANKIEVL